MPVDMGTAVFYKIIQEKIDQAEALKKEQEKNELIRKKALEIIIEAFKQTYRFGGFNDDYIKQIAERDLNTRLNV